MPRAHSSQDGQSTRQPRGRFSGTATSSSPFPARFTAAVFLIWLAALVSNVPPGLILIACVPACALLPPVAASSRVPALIVVVPVTVTDA